MTQIQQQLESVLFDEGVDELVNVEFEPGNVKFLERLLSLGHQAKSKSSRPYEKEVVGRGRIDLIQLELGQNHVVYAQGCHKRVEVLQVASVRQRLIALLICVLVERDNKAVSCQQAVEDVVHFTLYLVLQFIKREHVLEERPQYEKNVRICKSGDFSGSVLQTLARSFYARLLLFF
ncbi:MAG: hypothetical protein LQ342_006605 [Letrouitia transgressa]|nr:MAG: hypothetical protein LQ342_006605 [Letrouitia transgressa]